MAGDFDPYYKWLDIPSEDQPPHYYRLLGIELFEADPEVIAFAAEQRTRHVRSFQTGEYALVSQKMQKKIAAAKNCLLDPAKKTEYDISLRLQLRIQPARSPSLPEQSPRLSPALQDYLEPPPIIQTTSSQYRNTDYSLNPIVIVKETCDWLRHHKKVTSVIVKLGYATVAVIILLMVFAHGRNLWTLVFDKSSDLISHIDGSAEEKPPERIARIRSIPEVKPQNPANSTKQQPSGITATDKTEGQPNTVPPPPNVDSAVSPETPDTAQVPPNSTSAAPPRSEQPVEITSLTLPSGKNFNTRLFKINLNLIIDALKESAKEDQVLLLEDPSGRICAFTEHKIDNLNGIFVAYNENRLPVTYATYIDGALDGMIKTWNEKGDRVYWCQYTKGVRNGFCCYFQDNFLRMLLEIDNDAIAGIHLCANGSLEKSFSSIEQASADKDARILLDKLDNLESDLKISQDFFKKTAQEENLHLRRERKGATTAQKKFAFQEHLNQHAAERQFLLKSFWQYKGW